VRNVYVISDLHLGGDSFPPASGKRGFRLCTGADAVPQFIDSLTHKLAQQGPTELKLNGDSVHFLAEHDEKPNTWSPFTRDPKRAAKKLEAIVKRDQVVFDAIGRILDKGGRLVAKPVSVERPFLFYYRYVGRCLAVPQRDFDVGGRPAISLADLRERNELGDFSAWTLFRPTNVHIELGDDSKISKAELLTFWEGATS
jgi:hypothetical protein